MNGPLFLLSEIDLKILRQNLDSLIFTLTCFDQRVFPTEILFQPILVQDNLSIDFVSVSQELHDKQVGREKA